jgi:hypothetical protein
LISALDSFSVERVLDAVYFNLEAVDFVLDFLELAFCRHVLDDMVEHLAELIECGLLCHTNIVRAQRKGAIRGQAGLYDPHCS